MSPALRDQLELLPHLLSAHLTLTLVALALGLLISLPLAAVALRVPWVRGPALATASVVQTAPSLALLALMVPLLGQIGRTPAIIALTLYSVLPILRNTITGVQGVDAAVIEAARGVGMRPTQILMRVQLPLASPIIIAGVRTATVWVVGIATLSTPVGAASLGNYIFSGLQTQNNTAVLVGCAAAALLALTLDGLIRLFETAATRRSGRLALLAGAIALAGLAAVYTPALIASAGRDARPRVVVGAKTFTEQYILSALIADRLERAGFRAQRLDSLGSSVVLDALIAGEIDCYVDYTGTIWANAMRRTEPADAQTTLREVGAWTLHTHGVVTLGALGFENAYAFAMRADDAERLGVRTLDDLTRHAHAMRIGGDYEFFARPEWASARDAYALRFRQQLTFDSTLMYAAIRDGHVDVVSAFSTDGRIDAFGLVVLDDPRSALPPYDAVILLSKRAAADVRIVEALRPLIGRIKGDAMRRANRLVDVDARSVSDAATDLARSAGLPAP
jgi:osmoprotectant transport system permease protein